MARLFGNSPHRFAVEAIAMRTWSSLARQLVLTRYATSVRVLLASELISSMTQMFTAFVSMFLGAEKISALSIGRMLTVFGAGTVAGSVLGGRLSQVHRPARLLAAIFLLNGVLITSVVAAKDQLAITGVLLGVGLCSGTTRSMQIILLTRSVAAEQRSEVFAFRRVALNLGLAIGSLIIGSAASAGFAVAFSLIGVLCGVVAIMLAVFLREAPTPRGRANDEPVEVAASSRSTAAYPILVPIFLVMLSYSQVNTLYPLYLTEALAIDAGDLSLLFALNGIMIVVLQVPVSWIMAKRTTANAAAMGALLTCAGLAASPLCSDLYALGLACIVWTIGEIIFYPESLTLILRCADAATAKSVGSYQAVLSAAALLAPLAGTALYSVDATLPWTAMAVVAVAAPVMLIVLSRPLDSAGSS